MLPTGARAKPYANTALRRSAKLARPPTGSTACAYRPRAKNYRPRPGRRAHDGKISRRVGANLPQSVRDPINQT
eukprot:2340832-Lingulodinium_polyedra.AAC.1